LPVILHVRRAQDRVLKFLRRYPVPGGIAHAFNGSDQQAEAFLKLGFKLGFGGAMTYSGSTRIRRLASTLPLSSLVLETDAPDIRPDWAQDTPNRPANVARFAALLAGWRGVPVEEIARQTTANAVQALGLKNS
jgi:TatD DNase family protein